MGSGSRGGSTGGSTSSGSRIREDKEGKSENRRRVDDKGKSSSNSKSSSSSSSSSRGRRGLNFPNGFPNFGLPRLGSGNKSNQGSGQGQFNSTPPPAQQQNKIPNIKKIGTTKIKLTKQSKNKAPN